MERSNIQTIGKYRILGALGRGSMGVVYKAQDPEIGRIVAIKTLRRITSTKFHDMDVALERFKNEARSAGNLRHPNIITVFEVNIENDVPYIVMDYVEGESLDVIFNKQGRLMPAEVLHYMEQTASGLNAAHEKGIVHRDIKPSNLIVDAKNRLYILDFGVAKMNQTISDEEQQQAKKDPVMGTPGYMSPEQILNKELDIRSDLFSLAIVAFEALTGERPFPGETFTETVSSILNSKPTPLTSLAPELPLALELEFEKALAQKAQDRFATAKEMILAFKEAMGDLAVDDGVVRSGKSLLPARKRKKSSWQTLSGKDEWEKANQFAKGEKDPSLELSAWSSAEERRKLDTGDFVGVKDREKKKKKGPGGIFALGDERIGLKSSISMQSSLVRVITAVLGIASILFGGAIIFILIENSQSANTKNREYRPREQQVATTQSADPGPIKAITEVDYDPIPEGKLVSEMSDREILGVLVNSEASEALILGALNEAKERRIPRLPAAALLSLDSDSYVVRVETIKTLADFGDRRVVPKLVSKLDDYDPLVRRQAALALERLGSRAALGYLKARYSKESVKSVKEAIKHAIEEITGYPFKP